MTIDGVRSAVGSTNLDDRSFETNDEFMLGILEAAIARRLNSIFKKYAAGACEIHLNRWSKRGLMHRIKDHVAYLINEIV